MSDHRPKVVLVARNRDGSAVHVLIHRSTGMGRKYACGKRSTLAVEGGDIAAVNFDGLAVLCRRCQDILDGVSHLYTREELSLFDEEA